MRRNLQLWCAAVSQAILHTNAGPITVEFHDEDAPKTVENFRKLAADGFYDCLLYTSPSPRDGLLSRMPSSA